MSAQGPKASHLWKYCDRMHIGRIRHDLRRFRSSRVNHKIALFDPNSNGVRYLQMLIYCMAGSLSEANWQRLRNTGNRKFLGDPITVTRNGEAVCLDYLQAVLELEFIAAYLADGEPATVIEIGAGYGRTAHMIACNCKIKAYRIVDLPGCLALSEQYLKQVLTTEQFERFQFIPIADLHRIENQNFDLAINIDSFAEMDRNTVHCYLDRIERQCRYFYVKNPVCNNLVRPADPTLGGGGA